MKVLLTPETFIRLQEAARALSELVNEHVPAGTVEARSWPWRLYHNFLLVECPYGVRDLLVEGDLLLPRLAIEAKYGVEFVFHRIHPTRGYYNLKVVPVFCTSGDSHGHGIGST